jgi:hypothetical protein
MLDKFLNNALSDKETEIIIDRLKTDKDLKEDLEFLKLLQKSSRHQVLTDKKSYLEQLESGHSYDVKKNSSRAKLMWTILAIIGALIIGIIFFYKMQRTKDQNIYASVFSEQFESKLILHKVYRSTEKDTIYTEDQLRAYDLYSIKEFDLCIPLLHKLWKDKSDTLALFYIGVCEIGRGNYKKGKDVFERSELEKYREEINLFNK